jgi:hypothetical protein
MIFQSIAALVYKYQRIKGYESNYPRKTVSSAVKEIVMPGFAHHFVSCPEDESTSGGGGEVCSLSLHCSGEGYIQFHFIFHGVWTSSRRRRSISSGHILTH